MRKDAVFCNAVCKANEVRLLGGEYISRIASATFDDAVKMLHDYGYNDGILDRNFDVDDFICREVNALICFVKEYSPTAEVEDFVLAPFLFNNIKAEYKVKSGGTTSRLYEVEGAEGVRDGDYSRLDEHIAKALVSLDGEKFDPRKTDLALTKTMYAYRLAKAKKYRLLMRYERAEIDTVNIVTALRAEKLGLSDSEKDELFIEGGTLAKPIDLNDTGEYSFDLGDITRLETQIENYLLGILQSDAGNMDSVGPLVYYFNRKYDELKTVKMILICLKSGARREIEPRIRGIL